MHRPPSDRPSRVSESLEASPTVGPTGSCARRSVAPRRLGLVVLGWAAFLSATWVVARVQGPLRAASLRPQLEAALADLDGYDAVFIGSSRVQRGVQPEVLDARLSTPGRPFRSFNLGVAGMKSFEADRVVSEVLAAGSSRLRLLLIEAPEWQVDAQPLHMFTARFTDWHDPHRTWLVLRSIWRSEGSWLRKLELSWMHVRLFFTRLSNYGSHPRFGTDSSWSRRVKRMADVQGYLPLEIRRGNAARRRAAFVADPSPYEAVVRQLRQRARRGDLSDASRTLGYDRESLRQQVERIERAGLTPVYLVPPLTEPTADFAALAEEGLIPHLIDLRDPLEYPELFRVENRFDKEHMSIDGAREMSRAIAEQLEPVWNGVAEGDRG